MLRNCNMCFSNVSIHVSRLSDELLLCVYTELISALWQLVTQLPKTAFFSNKYRHSWILWFFSHYVSLVKAHAALHQAEKEEKKVCDIRDGGLYRTMIPWPGFWIELLWWLVLCDVSCSVFVVCWESTPVGCEEENRNHRLNSSDIL